MGSQCVEQVSAKEPGSMRFQQVNVVAGSEEDIPTCWICLDGATDRPLMHPCKCPSYCHASCIARWQLQSAGTRRERYCDFCNSELPDWKSVLTPTPGATAPAVMNVNFDNKTYSFQVAPGVDGYRQFTEAIRKAFHLPEDSELNITFTCDEPSSAGSLLTLSGPGAYDAAVHCASVSAAKRSISADERTQAARRQHAAVFGNGTAGRAGSSTRPGNYRNSHDSSSANCPVQQHELIFEHHEQPDMGSSSDGGSSSGARRSSSSRRSSMSSTASSSSNIGLRTDQEAVAAAAGVAFAGQLRSNAVLSSPFSTHSSNGGGSSSLEDTVRGGSASGFHSNNSSARFVASSARSSTSVASVSDTEHDMPDQDATSTTLSRDQPTRNRAAGGSSGGMGRRNSGLGRKLRDAITDLLISK